MNDLTPSARLSALLRSLDDLLAEAERLRQEIGRTIERTPFWPERRRVNIPYEPDRRQ